MRSMRDLLRGGEWCVNYHETKTHAETASELAWEHYQAERMKAAASTEKEIEMTNKGHERTVTEIIEQMKDRFGNHHQSGSGIRMGQFLRTGQRLHRTSA